jgi:DNA-directed RNA polymerase specialized sigma subunit
VQRKRLATFSDLHKGWVRVAESQRIDVEKCWAEYRDTTDSLQRRRLLKRFVKWIKDEEFDELARMSICWHLVRNRHNLPEESRNSLKKAIRRLSKRQRKIIKLIR